MPHFKTMKELLRSKLPGVDEERIAIRTQGCWNCLHFSYEKAANLWWNTARTALLNSAVKIALNSPRGEDHPKVRAIRTQVPMIDEKVHLKEVGCCSQGKTATGESVGDFVFSTFLCDRWTAKEGASVAREGQAADKLPEELMDRLHEKKVE